jgi:hypothetical protein
MVPGPRTVKEAVERVKESELSPEDAAALDGADPAPTTAPSAAETAAVDDGAIPEWVILPDGFAAPPEAQVYFCRFIAKNTARPSKGDRQCILWPLSYADEKAAHKRAAGESGRVIFELAKQMIRVVDGKKVDWSRGRLANVESFWDDIGSKYRQILSGIYYKAHNLDGKELTDFFLHSLHVASVQGG